MRRAYRVKAIFAMMLVACGSLSSPATLAMTQQERASDRKHEEEVSRQHLQKGREAVKSKNFERALAELKRAWLYDNNSAEVNLLLGMVYDRLGDKKQGDKFIEWALKFQPESVGAHYMLARRRFEDNDLAAARQQLAWVLDKDSQYAPAYGLKGELEITEYKYQEAIASFEEAQRLAKEDDVWKEDFQEKIETLRRLIEITSQQSGPGYTRPRLLNRSFPSYTEEARANKVNGDVRMYILINEEGEVVSVIPLSRLGYGLDEQAVKAARAMKFSPATKDGNPVPFWTKVDISFSLR